MDSAAHANPYLDRSLDLGDIGEPLLICGGAYSNLEALTAFFETADRLGFAGDRIVHTGDVVAYCADPEATARLLRERGVHAIQGNMEESLGVGMSDCGCGFEDGTPCAEASLAWFSYVDRAINEELRRWMGHMPCQLVFTMAGRRVRVIHGGVREINAFYFASSARGAMEAEFAAGDADILVGGHSGLPFTRRIGSRVWHNSGPLGMPANDGTPRVWYSVMVPENGAVRFEHHPLEYDHRTAHDKMIRAGLPDGYARALLTGLWPSLDILPGPERATAGKALAPAPEQTVELPAPTA